MSTFKPIGWSNCHDVRVAKSKQKWKNQEGKFLSWNFALKTVDDTGIEPVTPKAFLLSEFTHVRDS
jgi:hypothetical protein